MSYLSDVLCPRCQGELVFLALENTVVADELTDKKTSSLFREVWCQKCEWTGQYVPWSETSQGNASRNESLPLTTPPEYSNAALILDAQRLVLASEPSCGVAVYRAQSFENAEYIVWCVGTVLKRVRTAQVETVKGVEGERESYRYHHVWGEGEGVGWGEFFATGEHEGKVTATPTQTQNG